MIKDPFASTADSASAPATRCFAIVPADGTDLLRPTKALYIGTGGDITLRAIHDTGDTVFRALPAGCILDVRVQAVRATGTTASNIVGLA